ncbi:MAG: hypothetical protein PHE51_12700 [Eubacteriales bacterium]|nr:hypothetical protein [Eubacteriales bacterium]
MVIALIICIPITAIVVGIVVLKAVQLGLRWQLQAVAKQEPTMNNPIVEAIQQKNNEKSNRNLQELIHEWQYGAIPKEGD